MQQYGVAFRMALEDVVLPSGVRIKKGTMATFHTSNHYFSSKLHDHARTFDPDRDLKLPSSATIYWGKGAHPCAGQKVAEVDLAFIIAYAISKHNFVVLDEPVRNLQQMGNIQVLMSRYLLLFFCLCFVLLCSYFVSIIRGLIILCEQSLNRSCALKFCRFIHDWIYSSNLIAKTFCLEEYCDVKKVMQQL
jgi:hypothetical protein